MIILFRNLSFIFLALLSLQANAKDYFGLNLDSDNFSIVREKARIVFADADKTDTGLRIQGNGLLRLHGWLDYVDISFSKEKGICAIDIYTTKIDEEKTQRLINHLRKDYDLTDLTTIPYSGEDQRQIKWIINKNGNNVVIHVLTNNYCQLR
jgi:hypothetical protein